MSSALSGGIRKRLFMLIGASAVAGATIFGVLQFRWIRDASRTAAGRERRNLSFAMENALDEVGAELWSLLSCAMAQAGERTNSVDPVAVRESVEVWRRQTSYPDLLRSLLLFSDDGEAAFEIDASGVREIPAPELYLSLLDTVRHAGRAEASREFVSMLTDGMILLPYASGANVGPASRSYYLAVEIDLFVMINRMLPSAMETYLPGYAYRVVRNGKAVYVHGEADFGRRKPDLVRGLFASPFLGPVRGVTDPLSRYWAFRLSRSGKSVEDDSTRLHIRDSVTAVELYNADLSLGALMLRRRIFDLAASYGLLALFLATLYVMFRFYDRSERYRRREREFVATMSHELRTPVSIIRSIAENLADGVPVAPSRLSEYGALIREQSERLGRMVESILMTSGMSRGVDYRMKSVPTDVGAVIEDAVRVLDPSAREAGVSVRVVVDVAAGDEDFITDPTALRLIVENLTINAIRHGFPAAGRRPNVEVRASVGVDRDGVVAGRESRILRLAVQDEGPGVPQHEQRRVFDAFYRMQSARDGRTPGAGLGLHLVRRAAGLLGGAVRVESPYTRDGVSISGARFVVELPEGGAQEGG